ncbi:Dolichyl-diphosphooligosaccharide--protein glycosyltransferase subunit 1A [Hibiscus syriacus]|uniref:Dolichyl-diphosphooligosaccharide--protein glycosyltransferase subunit 1 n=1 Tax=Hibiscus syriacus TaxID=106335 RepID=A0A6A3BLX1_HIBSY|nr:Dolichyl-diphosphooligosaccharide--protein glycosyltransferase subunit 1A [Hibiscus syriacus]
MESSRFFMLMFTIAILASPALSDLLLSKVDRRAVNIYINSVPLSVADIFDITHCSGFFNFEGASVENAGPETVSAVLLAFPEQQAKNMAYLMAAPNEGKGKLRNPVIALPVAVANPKNMPPALTFYSVTLPKGLAEGDSFTFVCTHLSPYAVNAQSLTVKLPDSRIESYTKLENTKIHGSEINYGPYENLPAFSYSPIAVHFESNQPFAVAQELVREIEISHWGNVQITEHFKLIHGGAQSKGEFSRLDFQARPNVRGASAFRYLVANLPPRAHSVYYRDEIGNISTSHLRGDSKKTELLIEPRYPMFGGWRTAFTIGYGLPLQDFLYESEGKRFLNITYGSPMVELVIDTLIVKVVLPEGSSDISVAAPFPVEQWLETKISHLDIDDRPVVVLKKTNVVPEHNQYFQVYYRFSKLSILREPLMLISGFFLFFVACIVYMRADISISKSSASYLAKQQWEEVQAVIQLVQNIVNRCLATHDKMEASLRDLYRTGDIQACKAARKAADGLLKELSKELKPLLITLQSSPSAAQILPKVEDLVAKERELQEKVMVKHSTVVDGYEKKSGARDMRTGWLCSNRNLPH